MSPVPEPFAIAQLKVYNSDHCSPVLISGDDAYTIVNPYFSTSLELINAADAANLTLSQFIQSKCYTSKINTVFYHELLENKCFYYYIRKPIFPPEIWACGVTYKRQADLHDQDIKKNNDMLSSLYSYVHSAKRPEIFFKGTNSRCTYHTGTLHIRNDSTNTMPEAELAFIVGNRKNIVGYTICNDMTAWDLEKESPLYLSYCKIYSNSCSIGPVLVPAEFIPNPRNLHVSFTSYRNNEIFLHQEGTTSLMVRSLDELLFYLYENNTIPAGTVLSTGTAVHLPHDYCSIDGEINEITIESIGTLRNVLKKLP